MKHSPSPSIPLFSIMNQNLTLQQAAKLLDEFYKGITTVAE